MYFVFRIYWYKKILCQYHSSTLHEYAITKSKEVRREWSGTRNVTAYAAYVNFLGDDIKIFEAQKLY